LLFAYLSKHAISTSTSMDPEWALVLGKWNARLFYVLSAFFVLFFVIVIVGAVRVFIESRRPQKDLWEFYVDAQGRQCMKGKFLYRWHKGKGKDKHEQVCTRSFDGTIEEFLAFNQKWQACAEQESYRHAATERLQVIREALDANSG